jgi:hypothetical protein
MGELKRYLGTAAAALGSLLNYSPAMAEKEAKANIPTFEEQVPQANEPNQFVVPNITPPEQPCTKQEILIPFSNPARSTEANTQAYLGATRLFGKGLEYISKETGASDSAWGRAGELILGFTGDSLAEVISHESSHKREIDKCGGSGKMEITPFKYGIFSGGYYEYGADSQITPEQDARVCWAGLNQHTLNADEISRRAKRQKNTIDDISYIGNTVVAALKTNGIGDGQDVINGLAAMGMEAGQKDLQRNTTIITALDPQLAESVYNLGDFLANGERAHTPVSADIADGWKVYLPHFSQYFTPNGAFAKAALSGEIANVPIEIGVRHDLSFAQKDAELKAFQAGGRAYMDTGFMEVSPYAYLGRNDGKTSRAVGLGIKLPIIAGLTLESTVSHSANDLIEQAVKGNRNGWNGFAGLTVTF